MVSRKTENRRQRQKIVQDYENIVRFEKKGILNVAFRQEKIF